MRRKATVAELRKAVLDGLTIDAMAEKFGYASFNSCHAALWRNKLTDLYRQVQHGEIQPKNEVEIPEIKPPIEKCTNNPRYEHLVVCTIKGGVVIDNLHNILGEFEPYLPAKLEG